MVLRFTWSKIYSYVLRTVLRISMNCAIKDFGPLVLISWNIFQNPSPLVYCRSYPCRKGGWTKCANVRCPTRCRQTNAICCAHSTSRLPSRGSSAFLILSHSPFIKKNTDRYNLIIMLWTREFCAQRGVRDADLAAGVLPQRSASKQYPVTLFFRTRSRGAVHWQNTYWPAA